MTYTGETLDLIAANDSAIERQAALDAHALVHGYLKTTYERLMAFAREQGWQNDLVSHMRRTNWAISTDHAMRVSLSARLDGEMAYRATNGWQAAADFVQYIRLESREWAPTYIEQESGLEPPSIHDTAVGFIAVSPYTWDFSTYATVEQIESSTAQRWRELAELWEHLDEQSNDRDWCSEYDRFCGDVDRAQQSTDAPTGVYINDERPDVLHEIIVEIDVVIRVSMTATVSRTAYDNGEVEGEIDLDDDSVAYMVENELGGGSHRAIYNAIQSSEVANVELN